MDERLQELFYQVQRAAAEVGNAMGSAVISVNDKASEIIQTGKIRAQILDLKAGVGVLLREIGEQVYATHVGDPSDSEVLFDKLSQIDAIRGRIDELEAQLSARKRDGDETIYDVQCVPVCANCGVAGRESDLFCRECGARL